MFVRLLTKRCSPSPQLLSFSSNNIPVNPLLQHLKNRGNIKGLEEEKGSSDQEEKIDPYWQSLERRVLFRKPRHRRGKENGK